MRVRVNQYAFQSHPEVDEFLKKADKYIDHERTYLKESRESEAYICRKCGTELYTNWITFPNSRITYQTERIYYAFGGPSKDVEIALPAVLKAEGEQLMRILEKQREDVRNEEERLNKERICPICGTPSKRWQWKRSYSKDIEDLIQLAYSSTADVNKANEEVTQFIKMCDVPATSNYDIDDALINDSKKLKKFILHLLQLETNIVSLSKHLEKLYCERNKNEIFVNQVNYAPIFEAMQRREEMQKKLDTAQKAYKKCLKDADQCKKNKPMPVQIPEPVKPSEPNYQKPGLFNKKKVLAENETLEAQYLQDMQEYERKCQQRLLDIERKNSENQEEYLRQVQLAEATVEETRVIPEVLRAEIENIIPGAPLEVCPVKAQQKMIAAEIEKTENLLKDTYKARNELYAANVIFSKYRDIVALATFYEYLMAGRCTTLEGPDGAYNLYEAEIRANMIISKLSEIEKSLKNIEQTQYMIYSQLTEMNRTLDEMSSTMDSAYTAISKIETNTSDMSRYIAHISENSDVIAHNSTVTAYYSKLNAELTNALGFMVAMK